MVSLSPNQAHMFCASEALYLVLLMSYNAWKLQFGIKIYKKQKKTKQQLTCKYRVVKAWSFDYRGKVTK